MDFKNKIVLITGAAGQLGTELANKFVSLGAYLYILDASESNLNVLRNKLPKDKILGVFVVDISSPDSVSEAFKKIKDLDVLVNNAAIAVFTPFRERDYSDFMNVISVNLGGTFLCTQKALGLMEKQKKGCIVNIGSIYGIVSSDSSIYTDCSRMNSEVYSASKAAIIQLTKYYAAHVASSGVRVNCVSPGGIFNSQGVDFIKNYSSKVPMKRMADVSEICEAILFLASEQASYITGQNLVVDGGFTVW